jgi:hypothetical protein
MLKRLALASVVALCVLLAAAGVIINPGRHGARRGGGVDPAAIVMACGGNDANPGTLASPVKTFARAHALMASASDKHTYLRGNCTYPVSTNIWHYSNESYEGYPNDPLQSAVVNISTDNVGCSACSGLSILNLKIVGSSTAGAMMSFSSTTGLYIQANWIVDTVQQPLVAYNASNLYIQGNQFDAGTTSDDNAISTPYTDNAAHTNLYITDNTFLNCTRICIESQQQGPYGSQPQISNVHIDRNTCNQCMTVLPSGTYSFISAVTGPGTGSTLYGNTLTRKAGTTCLGGIEVVTQGMTIANNVEVNVCWNFSIAHVQESVFQNNYFTYDLMAAAHQGFTKDGDYDETESIGVNHYNVGSGFTDVAGCPPDTSPSYCTLGFNSYGTEPTTTSASTPYVYVR